MKNRKAVWIAVFVLVAVLGVGFAFIGQPVAKTVEAEERAPAPAVAIDVASALSERGLGDASAKVRIDEYASLTCSHCAHFSKESFDKIKEAYIDTGKVYFVFNDFPLNAPALEASMVARCLPHERYFQFVKFLFDTQDQWAFNKDYRASLKQNAKLLGMDDATFESCIGNNELKQGLIEKMQDVGKAKKIESTPSFVFNGNADDKILGAQPYEEFQKRIDALLGQKE